METLISERIFLFLRIKGLKDSDLCRVTNYKSSAISQVKDGKMPVPFKLIAKMAAAFPDLDMNWLLRGGGGEPVINFQRGSYNNNTQASVVNDPANESVWREKYEMAREMIKLQNEQIEFLRQRLSEKPQ